MTCRGHFWDSATAILLSLVFGLPLSGCSKGSSDSAQQVLAEKLDTVYVLVTDLDDAIATIYGDRDQALTQLLGICYRSRAFADSLYGPGSLWGRESFAAELGDWVPEITSTALWSTHHACDIHDLLLESQLIAVGIEIERFRAAAACVYSFECPLLEP